jgi:hypothetical protein
MPTRAQWVAAWRRVRKHVRAGNIILFILTFMITFGILTVYFPFSHPPKKSPVRFDNCHPCSNLYSAHGDSSPDDLILSGLFGGEDRVMPFLRSLRSVGSQASVVFITNRTVPPAIAEEHDGCGATFFVMETSQKAKGFDPNVLRFMGYRQYLAKSKRSFNRVFHTDSSATFFQSDPFTTAIRRDRLYFVLEGVTIENSQWNRGWVMRAYNESVLKRISNFTVSCSGTVLGGREQFLKYLDTMLGHKPFWSNGQLQLDQAYHNFLLYTGEFARNRIKPEFLGCNSQFLTMHYCSRGKKVVSGDRVISPDGEATPAVVHQYNMFHEAADLLQNLCQPP